MVITPQWTDEQAAAFLVKKFEIPVIEDKSKVYLPTTEGYILQLRYPPGHPNHKVRYFNSGFHGDIVTEWQDAQVFGELFAVAIAAIAKVVVEPELTVIIIKVEPAPTEGLK